MKISNRIPYDLNVSLFSIQMILFPVLSVLAMVYNVRHAPNSFSLGIMCLMLSLSGFFWWVARQIKSSFWSHFIGTKVTFTTKARLLRAIEMVDENGWKWNKDVCDSVEINSKKLTMLCRRREHALIMKLSA